MDKRTVKFTISVPADEFRKIESARRAARETRSSFIRKALALRKGSGERHQIGEEPSSYHKSDLPTISEPDSERKRRAIAAAGKFRSGRSDIALHHDRYLAEAYAVVAQEPAPPPREDDEEEAKP